MPEPRFAGVLGRYTAFQLQGNVYLRQHQIAFLNRIRESDPERQTIADARFNPRNELALVFAHGVGLDKIPTVMGTILTQMAQEFPLQVLTVVAYAPSDPPLKISTMTYTRER